MPARPNRRSLPPAPPSPASCIARGDDGWRSFRPSGREAQAFYFDRPIFRTGPGGPLPATFDLRGELCLGARQRLSGFARPPEIGQSGSGVEVRRKKLRPPQRHLPVRLQRALEISRAELEVADAVQPLPGQWIVRACAHRLPQATNCLFTISGAAQCEAEYA